MFHEIITFIVDTVSQFGYVGIFVMMFLESSFFPFPSEVVMIPAGYLVAKGEMNMFMVLLMGISGSLAGALFNYYLAIKFGRSFLSKYGKYVLFKEKTLQKVECFFAKHGHISTFSCRLIPAVRQYVSFPAGLAKMCILKFSIYTSLGAAIWVSILALLGFYIGENQQMIDEYLKVIIISILVLLVIMALFYMRYKAKLSMDDECESEENGTK